jgi:hypothetical protein
MCFREIILLFLLCFSFFFVAKAQKTKGSAVAYKIFEDLPLDEAGKKSVLGAKESLAEKINSNIFIKATLSKATCFAGEPVKITYELYSALANESSVNKSPSFQGFTVRKLAFSNDESTYKKINNKNFRVFTIDKNILTSYEKGKLILEPIGVHNVISYEDDNGETKKYEGDVDGQRVVISVLPLPEKGKPNLFSGAVGKFMISVKLTKNIFNANENNQVQVEISGDGNLTDFSFPAIKWPAGFEVFDVKERLKFDSSGAEFYTAKTYTATVVAKKEGQYTIAPLQVAFFDPAEARYKEIATEPLQLTINKAVVANPVNNVLAQPPATANRFTWPYAALALLLVLVIAAIAMINRSNRIKKDKRNAVFASIAAEEIPVPTSYEALIKSAAAHTQEKDFINAFKDVTKQYLVENTGGNVYPEEKMIEMLSSTQPMKAIMIKNLTEQCNQLLYSPGSLNENTRSVMAENLLRIVTEDKSIPGA